MSGLGVRLATVFCLVVFPSSQGSANLRRSISLPSDPNDPYYKNSAQVHPLAGNIRSTRRIRKDVLKSIPSKFQTAQGLSKNLPFLAHHAKQQSGVQSHSLANVFPSLQLNHMKQNVRRYDVVFIIDDSGSIPKGQLKQFKVGLKALRTLIEKSDLGTKFAAIKFSDRASLLFKFTSLYQAISKLTNVPYSGGFTNTQDALRMAREDVFLNPSSGHRPGAGRVAILLTDGNSNVKSGQTVPQANLLKAAGTKLFVIAVGNYGDSGLREMKNVCSSPYSRHFFRVSDFTAVHQVMNLV